MHAAMDKVLKVLRSPGAAKTYEGVAPTQLVLKSGPLGKEVAATATPQTASASASQEKIHEYAIKAKTRRLDRWLDTIVELSGSQWTFYTIVITLLTWAFLGIRFGTNNDWQIVISKSGHTEVIVQNVLILASGCLVSLLLLDKV